jgi:hypothetical protein
MHFLIVGCQRSGTTAIVAALSRHPEETVWEEADSYRLLSNGGFGPEGVVGFKVPGWTDLLRGATFGDSDQRLERPFEWSDEPLVHVLTHPVDVVASMDKLQMSGD